MAEGRPVVGARAAIALLLLAALVGLLFFGVGAAAYPWIKAAHVIAVISWMAGMLYLPRLFVYHMDASAGSQQSETFKVMERRLMRGIINPAMMATWVFGLWLAWHGFGFSGGWLHAKIALVLILSGVHGYLASALRSFAEDGRPRTAHHWRIVNEIPALLMIGIVILVIVKPF